MQLKISHKLAKPIVLPINYAHILQGIVYKALSEGQLSNSNMTELIHDIGWKFEQRSYKFFQFSGIAGHYQISGKNIIFDDSMSWEIRTPDSMIINSIKSGMEKSGIEYLSSIANNLELTLSDDSIEDNRLLIRMRTPICVYSTDIEGGKRYYYAPDEQEFYQAVTENFIRKYYAYTGVLVNAGIKLSPLNITVRDKQVTKFKGSYLSGWKGDYIVEGERKYLDFLYQCGIGARNSQGFGMFDIMAM